MFNRYLLLFGLALPPLLTNGQAPAQAGTAGRLIVTTGARFAYPLLQRWIDEYQKAETGTQIAIEQGVAYALKDDVIRVETDESIAMFGDDTQYLCIARYAVLPVANRGSEFARHYVETGLEQQVIEQLYFVDNLTEDEESQSKYPYNVYTRLDKSGAPETFARHFGFQQRNITGKAVAGSDLHLLKAILRDTLAVSYLPMPLLFDGNSGSTVDGIVLLPLDINGNGRISKEEMGFDTISKGIEIIEKVPTPNVPLGYIYLSFSKENIHPELLGFLRWVNSNGQKYLHSAGYLYPEPHKFNPEAMDQLLLEASLTK